MLYLDRPERKPEEYPRTAVGMFTRAVEYEKVAEEGRQTLYRTTETGAEYVNDAIGQYVPRILVRNVSEDDVKTIAKKQGMKPTLPRGKRGIEMWQHVVGMKPSQYISTTKELGEIKDPQGKSFNRFGRVRIDLLKIAAKNIHDPTTRKGQDTWKFSHPKDPQGPIRQALEDVVRTQEVLIRGEIPQDAITPLP